MTRLSNRLKGQRTSLLEESHNMALQSLFSILPATQRPKFASQLPDHANALSRCGINKGVIFGALLLQFCLVSYKPHNNIIIAYSARVERGDY